MKKRIRAISVILVLFVFCGVLSGCNSNKKEKQEPIVLSDLGIIYDTEFGGAYIDLTIDEFNAYGFDYGDSVSISFTNGYKLDDIPYYNGYYTRTGETLLVAYPGYPHIKVGINNGNDLWIVADLEESDKAEIKLVEKGAYLNIQQARNLSYKDERSAFPSDAAFANFRSVQVKTMKENVVYRSASPCDNQHKRAPYVDKLMGEAGVQFIVNLSDNEQKIEGYIAKDDFNSPNFLTLYNNGKVIPLALSTNYGESAVEPTLQSATFGQNVVSGLRAMTENDGPYLIHCTEGKDRTGSVCMLIEALCGASYDEIVADYMMTYYNYYEITKERDREKYDIIVTDVLDPMISSVVGDESVDFEAANLAVYAENYVKTWGMTDDEIAALKTKLLKQ